MAKKTSWDPQQIRSFVKEAKSILGKGWRFMVPEVQTAWVRSRALYIIQAQNYETIPLAKIDWLVDAMLAEAGLKEEV